MNRITQCLHGRGTVSAVTRSPHAAVSDVPGGHLAYRETVGPVVFWNITNRCNLSCLHCYSRSGPGTGKDTELTTSEARDLIDDLAGLGVPVLLFTGGEPLLRGDLFELAAHAASAGIRTALSTNGTLITAENARKIRDAGIGYVGISLDGARPETHNRFRGDPAAFSRAIAAFTHCRDAGIRCGVRVTLTRENAGELADLIDLSDSIGASRFCLYWLVPSGRGFDSYERLQLDRDQAREALEVMFRKAQEIDPERMEFLTVDAPQDCVSTLALMERENSPDRDAARSLIASLKGGCSAGVRVADIDPSGNIWPCQFARDPAFLVGNVRLRRFSETWSDPENAVLGMFRRKTTHLAGKCRECGFLDICGGGCRVRAFAATGEFSGTDPFCFVDETGREKQS
jgi:radical SAM protein with 4Fe4S-binding SPASM domain